MPKKATETRLRSRTTSKPTKPNSGRLLFGKRFPISRWLVGSATRSNVDAVCWVFDCVCVFNGRSRYESVDVVAAYLYERTTDTLLLVLGDIFA